jgi:hypothetical protein
MSFASVLARMKNRGLFLALFLLPPLRGAEQRERSAIPRSGPQSGRTGSRSSGQPDFAGKSVLPMRNSAPAIGRLDIPAYDWWNEALHGGRVLGCHRLSAGDWPGGYHGTQTSCTDVISTDARVKYSDAIRQGESSRHHGLHSRSRMSTFFAPREQRLRLRVSVGILLRIMRIILHSEQVSDRYGEIRSQNP